MISIAVIDYGMGNLLSVAKSLESCGTTRVADRRKIFVTNSAGKILSADGVVLPGVGAFDEAVKNLKNSHLWDILPSVIESKPFLGICLGFQLLFEKSEEGKENGLGILKGKIKLLKPSAPRKSKFYPVPHIGWNKVEYVSEGGARPPLIMTGIPSGSYFYFVHSYYAPFTTTIKCDSIANDKDIIRCATTYGGIKFLSAVSFSKVFACQFHPEKSGKNGLKIMENFVSKVISES